MDKTIETKKSEVKTKDLNLKTKTIEDKAEGKGFFTKRNVIILIITSLLSIGLVILTLLFIIPMDWSQFFGSLNAGLKNQLGWLWLTMLILFIFVNFIYNVFPMWVRLKSLGIKIPAVQYFLFAIAISFFKGVTPSNFIYDPYTIFWLKTQGVSTSRASSIMFSGGLLWQGTELLVHIPSFIIVMTKANTLLAAGQAGGITLIVLMALGIVIDILGTLFMVLLCFSRRAHYVMSTIFNKIKKALKMKYHTKEEIAEKYKNKAILRNDTISYFKNWKDTAIICVVLISYDLILFFILNASLELVNINHFAYDPVNVFNATNMAFNANRLNLIPGLAAGLEASLVQMLKALGGITGGSDDDKVEFIKRGIFLWRTFFTYFPCLIGLGGFGVLTGLQIRSYKKKKGSFISSKYE